MISITTASTLQNSHSLFFMAAWSPWIYLKLSVINLYSFLFCKTISAMLFPEGIISSVQSLSYQILHLFFSLVNFLSCLWAQHSSTQILQQCQWSVRLECHILLCTMPGLMGIWAGILALILSVSVKKELPIPTRPQHLVQSPAECDSLYLWFVDTIMQWHYSFHFQCGKL